MTEYAFFLVGNAGSGRALSANLLSHYLRVPQAASSAIVYDELAKRRGCARWELEACPASQLAPDLDLLASQLCAEDPGALVSPLLARGVRVIHGMRRRSELSAARADARTQGIEPVVVWLDRPMLAMDNSEITSEDADFIIRNHGSVGQLTNLVFELACEFTVAAEPTSTALADMHRLGDCPPEAPKPPAAECGDDDPLGLDLGR